MINGLIHPTNVNKAAKFLLELDLSHIDVDFKPQAKLVILNFKDAWHRFTKKTNQKDQKHSIENLEQHLCELLESTKALAAILNTQTKQQLARFLCGHNLETGETTQ